MNEEKKAIMRQYYRRNKDKWFTPEAREKRREYSKSLSAEQKRKKREYNKEWQRKNRERCKRYRDNYISRNPLWWGLYSQRNPETLKEAYARYRVSLKGRVAKNNADSRRAARKAGSVDYDSSTTAFIESTRLMKNYICYLCRDEFEGVPTIEHIIPLSRGGPHILSNLAHACPTCNRKKTNKTYEEYILWRRSFRTHRENAVRRAAPLLLNILQAG